MLCRNCSTRTEERRGTVVVMVAVSLVALMGFVAIAIDGGVLLDQRRQAQAACDSAALAAAADLFGNVFRHGGNDLTGSAKEAAEATALDNGYTPNEDCFVTVNIPPEQGKFVGQPGYVEVIIHYYQDRYFSKIFGTGKLLVTARAVARGQRGGIHNAIITLNPNRRGSLSSGGNGNWVVSGSPVHVNSADYQAMRSNGGGSLEATKGFHVAGVPGWSTPGGGQFVGPIYSGAQQIPDPLADLPVPDPLAMEVRSKRTMQITSSKTVTLKPGVYIGGISIAGQGNVVLEPGVYYMQGGGFSWGGQGSVTGSEVMIYNAPTSNSHTFNLSGQGSASLTPPTSGPYQGILFFQDRTSTTPVNVTGNGGLTLSGTFYAAKALMSIAGNGESDVIGAQYISYDLELGGNGNGTVSWSPDQTPGIRLYGLVE